MTRQPRQATSEEPKINVPKDAIADFCRRHAIRRLAFFVMQDEPSQLLQREVELHIPAFLSPYFRREVVRATYVCYPQG